jgi:hypothetical protein
MENVDYKTIQAQLDADMLNMEEIETEMNQQAEANETLPYIAVPKTPGQISFATSRDAIAKYKEEYKGLVIAGLQDKEGYKAVASYAKALNKMRTTIENQRKDMKRPIIDAGNMIDTEAKELTALLVDVIKPLEDEVKRIDKLQEDENLRVFRELKAMKDDRLETLKLIGFTFSGEYWQAGPDVQTTYDLLGTLNVIQFSSLCDLGKEAIKKIEDAKTAERERVKKLEDSRISMRAQVLTLSGYQSSVHGWTLAYTRLTVTLEEVKTLEDAEFMQKIADQKAQANKTTEAPAPIPGPKPVEVVVPFVNKATSETTQIQMRSSGSTLMLEYLKQLLAVPVPQFTPGTGYFKAVETIRNYIQKNINAVNEQLAKYRKKI